MLARYSKNIPPRYIYYVPIYIIVFNSSFTNRPPDHMVRVCHRYSIVHFGRIHFAVQIFVQSVAEYPDSLHRPFFVHLEVVWETHRRSIGSQHPLRGRSEFLSRIPTAYRALADQVVVHHATGVHVHAGWLAWLVSQTSRIIERHKMLDDVAGAKWCIAQWRGGHIELVVARQRMKIQHPRPIARVRRQAHTENAVHPVERYAVDTVLAVQRVRIEIWMVYPAWCVLQTELYIKKILICLNAIL